MTPEWQDAEDAAKQQLDNGWDHSTEANALSAIAYALIGIGRLLDRLVSDDEEDRETAHLLSTKPLPGQTDMGLDT